MWYKIDRFGYEGLSESIVSNLLYFSNIDSFVKYEEETFLYEDAIMTGCKSCNFKNPNEEIVTVAKLFESIYNKPVSETIKEKNIEDTIYHFVNTLSKLTHISENDIGIYLTKTLELDALILNNDRHFNNIPLIYGENGFHLGPIFDNGASLLSDTTFHPIFQNDDYEIEKYIEKEKARPFSLSFDEQINAIRNLFGCNLHLTASINEILPNTSIYNHGLIDRVQKVLEYQFDKYPEMFKEKKIKEKNNNTPIEVSEQNQSQMIDKLMQLDDILTQKGCKPITLNVVGGFSLILQGIRKDPNAMTDIDYVGDVLPDNMAQIIDDFGVKNNLGTGWINNNVLLMGSTLEELEFSTGKLHFEDALQLKTLNIKMLCKEDLLRMKVIAIDTNVMAKSLGGDFTRFKDFQDIKDLMTALNYSMLDLEMSTYKYVEEQDKTYQLIETFIEKGTKETTKMIDDLDR